MSMFIKVTICYKYNHVSHLFMRQVTQTSCSGQKCNVNHITTVNNYFKANYKNQTEIASSLNVVILFTKTFAKRYCQELFVSHTYNFPFWELSIYNCQLPFHWIHLWVSGALCNVNFTISDYSHRNARTYCKPVRLVSYVFNKLLN